MSSEIFRSSDTADLNYYVDHQIDDSINLPSRNFVVTDRKIPRRFLVFEDYAKERELILRGVEKYGAGYIPDTLSSPFKEYYLHFRRNLDIWEKIPIRRSLSKKDIIVGCLSQGPAYAEWLKKARYYTFADKVSEGGNEFPEEYVLPEYFGYDSIFRESELIHWKEETSDVEYCFVPVGPMDEDAFRREFKLLAKQILPYCEFKEVVCTLDWIKSSRGYNPDPRAKQTLPIRDSLRQLSKIGPGWFGRRTIIRPGPAAIRDTAIPDPDTLAKMKLTHDIFAEMCEHLPESGMSRRLSKNLDRVLRRKLFCHLDFKKAGLLFPRRLFVIMGEELEKLGLDTWFIRDLEDVYLDIDGDVYRTERGFCLGWVNEGLTIAIITLLRLMRRLYNLNYDFIVYNDDVLIGDQDDDVDTYAELFRFAAKEFFNSFQIFLSDKKIFTSKSAQFLEEYFYQDKYGLNMEKRSMGGAMFAKSLSSQFIWEAKMYSEVAFSYYQNESLLWECMALGRETKVKDEPSRPYKAGGWVTPITYGMDDSFWKERFTKYILSLNEVRVPNVTEKLEPFNEKRASDAKHRKISTASTRYPVGEEVREFLKESSLLHLVDLVKARLDLYTGKKKVFPVALDQRVIALRSKFWEPP